MSNTQCNNYKASSEKYLSMKMWHYFVVPYILQQKEYAIQKILIKWKLLCNLISLNLHSSQYADLIWQAQRIILQGTKQPDCIALKLESSAKTMFIN